MTDKFNVYDFIAVIIPGIFFLWYINLLLTFTALPFRLPLEGDLTKTTVLIVLGYITGLLIQGVGQLTIEKLLKFFWSGFPSERWLLEDDKKLTNEYKTNFWLKIQSKYNIEKPTLNEVNKKKRTKELKKKNQECFYLAYRCVKNETILIFNAQYGLFRSLLTTFLLVFLISLFSLEINYTFPFTITFVNIQKAKSLVIILIISTLGIIITYFRVKKRGEDFAKCILDSFLNS